jgi:hypothetical protein
MCEWLFTTMAQNDSQRCVVDVQEKIIGVYLVIIFIFDFFRTFKNKN